MLKKYLLKVWFYTLERISTLSLKQKLLLAVAIYILGLVVKNIGFEIMMNTCTHGNCVHGAYSQTSTKWVWKLGGHIMSLSIIVAFLLYLSHGNRRR